MVRLVFSIIFFISLFVGAQKPQNPLCWKTEINYLNNQLYSSQALYNQHCLQWTNFKKPTPDAFSLHQAYMTYQAEIKKTEKFSKDKVKHCYMGCRIAAETDLPTTEYVAWSKEQDDISDCKRKTHFEIKDYEATIDGAHHAALPSVCEKYCLTHW